MRSKPLPAFRRAMAAVTIGCCFLAALGQAHAQTATRRERSLLGTTPVSGYPVNYDALSVGGRVFRYATGVTMSKEGCKIVFSVPPTADLFETWIGFDDNMVGDASAMFAVKGDGQTLYQSDWIAKGDAPQKVSIPVKGRSGLTLQLTKWRYQDSDQLGAVFADPKWVRMMGGTPRRNLGTPRAIRNAITVIVNGTPVTFRAANPIQQGTRVLVPMREIFEALGAQVFYDAASGGINARAANSTVDMRAGSRSASVNGRAIYLDQPPLRMAGSTLVPLRFVAEALGASVSWSSASRRVTIQGS